MATVYAFTGEMTRSRAELAALVEQAGGTVGAKVSRSTGYCVVGHDGGGSRALVARSYGIPCITEDQLVELLRVERGAVTARIDRATAGMIQHEIDRARLTLA